MGVGTQLLDSRVELDGMGVGTQLTMYLHRSGSPWASWTTFPAVRHPVRHPRGYAIYLSWFVQPAAHNHVWYRIFLSNLLIARIRFRYMIFRSNLYSSTFKHKFRCTSTAFVKRKEGGDFWNILLSNETFLILGILFQTAVMPVPGAFVFKVGF